MTEASRSLPPRWSSPDVWLFGLYAGLIVYLLYGTGVVTDDFVDLYRLQRAAWFEAFIPEGILLNVPVFNTMRMIFYRLASIDWLLPIEAAKIAYVVMSFYMISRFFSFFLEAGLAMLAAFLFVFYPSHEMTVYWLGAQYLTLGLAFYCYAYHQARHGRLATAALFATLGSFTSYGSAPIALSLFVLCVAQRRRREGLVLLIPNLVFAVYYVVISTFVTVGSSRLPDTLSVPAVLKQLALQVVTFIDAVLGPSFWLKVYYAILENSAMSVLVGAAFAAGWYLIGRRKLAAAPAPSAVVDRAALGALTLLAVGNLAMFALTGSYPQLAFNSGNRVTTLGTMVLAYGLAVLPVPAPVRYGILGIMLAAVLGLSTHWKTWQEHQMDVIAAVRGRAEVAAYTAPAPLLVQGNQYSRLGPFSHIEFLSERWVVHPVFGLATDGRVTALPLNGRFRVVDGALWDPRDRVRFPLESEVTVYDSEAGRVFRVPASELNTYIESLPVERRHWVQMIRNERITGWILWLMPRLGYTF